MKHYQDERHSRSLCSLSETNYQESLPIIMGEIADILLRSTSRYWIEFSTSSAM